MNEGLIKVMRSVHHNSIEGGLSKHWRRKIHTETLILFVVLSVAMFGCDHALTNSDSTIDLEALKFTSASAEVGDALVVTAHAPYDWGENDLLVSIRASSGNKTMVDLGKACFSLDPERQLWGECSNEELVAITKELSVERKLMIGFKEEGTDRGVSEEGKVLVSDETKEQMVEWMRELEGVEVTRVSELMPSLTIQLQDFDPDLLGTVREHPNIDYVEPNLPGEWHTLQHGNQGKETVYGVIVTARGEEQDLKVESGDIVTATYTQPDGSTLETTIYIEQ